MAAGKKTGGRKKGSVNLVNKPFREILVGALHRMQLKPNVNLDEWGENNPTEFYRLCSKLIDVKVSNDPENPVPGVIIQIIPDPDCKPIE